MSAPLRILYDRNLALGPRLFPRLGRARAIDGRALTRADLADCDLLFVRSTCRLGAPLLEGTPVRFVGSGVAGTDHIDFPALRALGIQVATAPGCNAESVADYVVAALLAIGERQGRDWAGATLGIVGVGHVGSVVKRFAEEALGMKTLCCDPPRKDDGDFRARGFVPLEDLLPEADAVTLHVPLNEDGPYRTRGLIAGPVARRFKPGAVLLNFARGPVCDDALVATMLEAGLLSDAAFDCWEGEPDYPPELARLAAQGKIDPESIDEAAVARHLYLPDVPDPDLIIRTSGELRLSNFLLWQASYAELYVTPTLWPDFSEADFRAALDAFARRSRRYGGI